MKEPRTHRQGGVRFQRRPKHKGKLASSRMAKSFTLIKLWLNVDALHNHIRFLSVISGFGVYDQQWFRSDWKNVHV